MKKSFFTICSLLFFAFSSSAQHPITINAINASVIIPPVGIDSLGIVNLSTSTLPSFAPATNHTWSLKNTTYSSKDKITRFPGQNSFQFADSVSYVFDSVRYLARGMSYFVQQGRIRAKEIIDSQTQFVPTGTSRVDTLVYDYQEVFLSSPYFVQQFPETYQTSWNNNYSRSTYFAVTDVLLQLKKATARHYSGYTETNSVVGWGNMIVNSLDSDATHAVIPSDTLLVLQVQKMSVRLDSIFMPAVAAGISLYDTFHVKPAYADTTYERSFYRYGSVTPLTRVVYTDGNYTTVARVEVNTQNLSKVLQDTIYTSVTNVINNQKLLIYPNPVVNGNFFIEVPGFTGSGNCSYDIINIAGQVVSRGNLPISASQARAQIYVPSLAPGTYIVRVSGDNQLYGMKEIQILR